MVKMTSLEMLSPPAGSDTSATGEESSEFIVLPNTSFTGSSIHTPACSMNGFQMSVMSANSDLTPEELNYWLKELICGNTALKEALQRSNRMMHEQVSTVTAWRDQMMQTNNQHVAMLEEAKKTIQKLQEENELLKKSLGTESGHSAESCSQCALLENKVLALQEEVSALEEAKTALSIELEKQQNLQQHLEQSVKSISHNLGSLQSNSKTLESEKRELTALNNQLIAQLSNLSVAKKKEGQEVTVFCDDESGYAIVFPPDEMPGKEFDGDGLKGALLQLHEERLRVSELTQALAEERAEVACLKKLLEEKSHRVEILSASAVVQSTESGTYEGGKLPSQVHLHQSADSFNLHQGTEPSHPDLLLAMSYAQKFKERCENLQLRMEQYQEKLQQLQASDSIVIDQLQHEVKNLQEILREEKKNLLEANQNLEKMTQNYNSVLELLKYQGDQQKAKSAEQEDEKGKEHRLHIEQLDFLTAKLMNTQQQLEAEEQKVNFLKKKITSIEQVTETIPILKAQVELYKSDFENERIACESSKSEVEKLKKEVMNLKQELNETQNHLHGTWLKKRGQKLQCSSGIPKSKPRSIKSRAESQCEDHSLPKGDLSCPRCELRFTEYRELEKHVNQCLNEDV